MQFLFVCCCVCERDQVKQSCLERKHAADGCGCPAVTPSNGLMSITAFIQLTISSSLCLSLSFFHISCWHTIAQIFSKLNKKHNKKTLKVQFLFPSLHLQVIPINVFVFYKGMKYKANAQVLLLLNNITAVLRS